MSRVAQIAGICLTAIAGAAAAAASRRAPEESHADEPQPLETLRDFDAVALSGPDTLFVREGADWSVTVEGDPKAVERLSIYVRGHALHVGRRRGGPQDDDGAIVRVTLPKLTRASLAGSGDVRAEGMTGDRIEAALAGSGDMVIIGIMAREGHFNVAGSGTLSAGGTVEETKVSIAGSGDVNTDDLAAQRANVSIAGSGDAAVQASDSARVSLVGSGSVHVQGTENVRISKIGSGDVRCTT